MALPILRDLRGLRVQVIHPPDDEGVELVEHLRRIGCTVEAQWPIPETFAPAADVVLLTIDYESRDDLHKLLRNQDEQSPHCWQSSDTKAPPRCSLCWNPARSR